MNQGSAMLGLFLVIGLVMAFGWPAAILLLGPILIDVLIGRVLLPLLRFGGRAGFAAAGVGQQFQYLPPLEQALRRGSQGFALMVLAVLAAVASHIWFYGWRDFAGVLSRPDEFWPLIACAALLVIGAVRFFAGARASAGARDAVRWFTAAVRLGLGVAALVWLVRADLFGQFAAWPGGVYGCGAAFAGALWLALVSFMRLLLLSWPRGWALGLVGQHIRDTEFSWVEPRRRRWWQFWKGRDE